MKTNKILITLLVLISSYIYSNEFTISSYNCGGLSDHYDYLRAITMQKLIQERHLAEPENMALNDKIQQQALKILFSNDPKEKFYAEKEWKEKNFQQISEHLTSSPSNKDSPNTKWNKKSEKMITDYKTRPIKIKDKQLLELFYDYLKDINRSEDVNLKSSVDVATATMAKRILNYQMPFDIMCFQEADYLSSDMFPETYEVRMTESKHSINAIAWNKSRFELSEEIGNILGRAIALKLVDKETGKTISVASGHLTGCNPYYVEKNDSEKGDQELQTIINLLNEQGSDFTLIGMDSNVTSLHPRLKILKDANYKMDYDNFIENTCTNPYQILNTRIDWITLKSGNATITNIPVLGVGLNSMQTNISDHKPIAARISY